MMGHGAHILVVEVESETGQVSHPEIPRRPRRRHDRQPALAARARSAAASRRASAWRSTSRSAYDADGQPLTGTFEDYLLPTGADVPRVEVGTWRRRRRSPPTASRAAARAAGWSRPRAITTAVEDALAPFGVRIDELPITAEQIVGWAGAMKLDHAALMISDPERPGRSTSACSAWRRSRARSRSRSRACGWRSATASCT